MPKTFPEIPEWLSISLILAKKSLSLNKECRELANARS
jgi:hypothetical protein